MKLSNVFFTVTGACVLMVANAQAAPASKPVSQQLKDPKAADVVVIGHVLEPKQISVMTLNTRLRCPVDSQSTFSPKI